MKAVKDKDWSIYFSTDIKADMKHPQLKLKSLLSHLLATSISLSWFSTTICVALGILCYICFSNRKWKCQWIWECLHVSLILEGGRPFYTPSLVQTVLSVSRTFVLVVNLSRKISLCIIFSQLNPDTLKSREKYIISYNTVLLET